MEVYLSPQFSAFNGRYRNVIIIGKMKILPLNTAVRAKKKHTASDGMQTAMIQPMCCREWCSKTGPFVGLRECVTVRKGMRTRTIVILVQVCCPENIRWFLFHIRLKRKVERWIK
jgi:hypothetical protein